jgi:hypothetical protein
MYLTLRGAWDRILEHATREALEQVKVRVGGMWYTLTEEGKLRCAETGQTIGFTDEDGDNPIVVTEIRTPVTEVAHVGGDSTTKCL